MDNLDMDGYRCRCPTWTQTPVIKMQRCFSTSRGFASCTCAAHFCPCTNGCGPRCRCRTSCDSSTLPTRRRRFLPSFCFSSSFFFLVTSPPPTCRACLFGLGNRRVQRPSSPCIPGPHPSATASRAAYLSSRRDRRVLASLDRQHPSTPSLGSFADPRQEAPCRRRRLLTPRRGPSASLDSL